MYVLDPVERLYSFINHCVHNQWPFCQKWNFQIEPIIEYATKFFEKYNSTSWYDGIRATGYPSIWYDDFLNVSSPKTRDPQTIKPEDRTGSRFFSVLDRFCPWIPETANKILDIL